MRNLNIPNMNNFVSARGAYYGKYGIIVCLELKSCDSRYCLEFIMSIYYDKTPPFVFDCYLSNLLDFYTYFFAKINPDSDANLLHVYFHPKVNSSASKIRFYRKTLIIFNND